jgi:hypothetical protein
MLSNCVPLLNGKIPYEKSADWVVKECKTGNRLTIAVRKRSPLTGMAGPGAGGNFQRLKPPRGESRGTFRLLKKTIGRQTDIGTSP